MLSTTLTRLLLPAQIVGLMSALSTLAFYPPVDGKVILLPIDGRSDDSVVALALASGMTPVGRGPIAGSWVTVGRRPSVAALLGHGVIVFAAPPAGCGGPVE